MSEFGLTGNTGPERTYVPGYGLEGVDFRFVLTSGGLMVVPVTAERRVAAPTSTGDYGVRGVDFDLWRLPDGRLKLVPLEDGRPVQILDESLPPTVEL